ncbi:MAG: transcription-repair coupling factor, partial [Oscillospiraceae bacterium]|nr:transcription-repair coupling factor [Oscillospiraceae bacterium]
MSFFESTFQSLSAYRSLSSCIDEGISPVSLTGLSTVHKAQLALVTAEKTGKPVLVISQDENEARKICSDINNMYSAENTPVSMLFPSRELILAPVEGISGEFVHARLAALSALAEGSCRVISASIEAVMQPVIPKEQLEKSTITLSPGDTAELSELAGKLVAMGYVRADTVEGQGQFAVRGAIADIFPAQAANPVRMEFWGDEIDTISEFSTESQRRISSLAKVTIPPAREIICDPLRLADKIDALSASLRGKHSAKAKEFLSNDAAALRDGLTLSNADKYIPLIYDRLPLIFEYGFGCVIFSEFSGCTGNSANIMSRYSEDVKIMLEEGTLCRGLTGHIAEMAAVQHEAEKNSFCIYVSSFLQGGEHVNFRKLLSVDA